jgi:hypothetical protein
LVLDQVGLKMKAMSQEISDLHLKKLILERENALYAKKSQHGLGFSSSSIPSAGAPVTLPDEPRQSAIPPSSSSSSSSSSSTSAVAVCSHTSLPPHALADVTNFEFNASPTTPETEAKATIKPSAVHKEKGLLVDGGKENALVLTTGGTKEKPSRSGSRREPRDKDRTAAEKPSRSGSRREDTRDTTKQRSGRAPLQRTVSSTNNRI